MTKLATVASLALLASMVAGLAGCPDKAADPKPDPAASVRPAPVPAPSASAAPKAGGGW